MIILSIGHCVLAKEVRRFKDWRLYEKSWSFREIALEVL